MIQHRTIETNGIRMHLAEGGSGPLVVLCHGFPESWYSWRHQLPALAAAGFHAVAPDMRGYGATDAPEEIGRYTLLHLVGDVIGILDALGAETAVVVGHDWGAPVAWHAALLRPDRVRGVVGLRVPYRPRGTAPATHGVSPRPSSGATSVEPFAGSSIPTREKGSRVSRRGARLAGRWWPDAAACSTAPWCPMCFPTGSRTPTSTCSRGSSPTPASAGVSTGIEASIATGNSWLRTPARA